MNPATTTLNVLLIFGGMALLITVFFFSFILKRARKNKRTFLDELFPAAQQDDSFLTKMGFCLKNCLTAFFFGVMTSTVFFTAAYAAGVARFNAPGLLGDTIVGGICMLNIVIFQVVAGYKTFKQLGKKAVLYSMLFLVVVSVMFPLLMVFRKCRSESCRKDRQQYRWNLEHDTFNTYGIFSLAGGIFAAGQLIGGSIVTIKALKRD